MDNYNPLEHLAEMLENVGIPYEIVHNIWTKSNILCYPNAKNRRADAIYFPYSYGYEQKLLEVSGEIIEINDDVEGYLSAEEVFKRIKKLWEADNNESKSN